MFMWKKWKRVESDTESRGTGRSENFVHTWPIHVEVLGKSTGL